MKKRKKKEKKTQLYQQDSALSRLIYAPSAMSKQHSNVLNTAKWDFTHWRVSVTKKETIVTI